MERLDLSPEQFLRTKSLFESALELDADERDAWLAHECANDHKVRSAVERLLAAHDSGDDSFLISPQSDQTVSQHHQPAPGPGTKFGSYEIVEKLGQGGMGAVYRGWDSLLQRPVAIKFVSGQYAHSAQARQRFLREARAASKLSHQGIATVHNAGEHEGHAYIVFRLIEGETVADRVQRGLLPPDEALRLIREAAEALRHAHDGGVLHRDVTSRNLMVDRNGSAVIVDFGLALPEMDARITQPGSTFGTLGYMAPEVVQGQPHDRRSDLYGLGVVLYEMLTGSLPFQTDRPESLLFAIVNEPLQSPSVRRPELGEDIDRVLLKMLARDPVHRYQSCAELIEDLDRLRRGAQPTAELPTVRRRRWPWLVALLAVVALAGIGDLLRRGASHERSNVDRTRVAILPLQNASPGDSDGDYIAGGLSEYLATRLTLVSGLRVTPWLTSQNYAPGPILPLPDIADELGVELLVAGTFRKEGLRLIVTLSLVDETGEAQNWSETFTGTSDDLLLLNQQIATAVATALHGDLDRRELTAVAQRPTENEEAYRLYLQGAGYFHEGSESSTKLALACFEKAVELDPDLALAHVALGACRSAQYHVGWLADPSYLELAESSYRTALVLDPQLWTAHRGLLHVAWAQGRAEECLQIGQRAERARADDIEALLTRAEAFFFGGLAELSVPLFDRVILLDPANRGAMVLKLFAVSQFDARASIAWAEESLRRIGEDAEIYEWLGVSHASLGETEAARLAFERCLSPELSGASRYAPLEHAILEAGIGNAARAREICAQVIAERRLRDRQDHTPELAIFEILLDGSPEARQAITDFRILDDDPFAQEMAAFALASVGRNEEALALLEHMIDRGVLFLDVVFFDWPSTAGLRAQPGFESYMRKRTDLEQRLQAKYAPKG